MSNISGGVNEEAVNGPIDSADETISLSELPIDSADRTISLNQLGVERGVIPEEPTESPGAEGPRLPQTFAELSKQLGQRSEETEFLDLEAMGFDKVTRQDLQGLDGVAGDRPGFFDALGDTGAEDLPFVGVVPQAKELFELQQAGAAHQIGDSSREQQLLLLRARARAAQDPTFAGGVADFLVGFGTTGVEIGTSFGVGAATKVTAKTGLRLARKELLDQITEQSTRTAVRRVTKKVVEGAGLAGTTATLQEVVPRFFHEDGVIRGDGSARGAWTLNHARRAFAEWDMTDEEAQLLATIANENLADFLDAKVDRWKGFQESFIQNAAEQTGGAIARIPGISYLQAVQARTFQRIAGSVAKEEGIERILGAVTAKGAAKVAQFDGPLGEVLEEVVSGMAVEGLLGESFIDGLPDSIEQAAQLFAAAAFFPGGRAVLNRARNEVRMRLPSRQREAQEQAQADAATVPAEEGAPGSQSRVEPGASPQNGGEQISPGEATAETAGVEPGVLSVSQRQARADVASFRAEVARSGGVATDFEIVEPETQAAAEAQRLLQRSNIAATFVRAGEDAPAGFFPGEGRAVINVDSGDLQGAALNEAWHTWEAQQTPERVAALEAELQGIDSDLIGRIDAFTQSNPILAQASPELRSEESRATRAQLLAPLISYLDTPQGTSDFAAVYLEEPGRLRQTLEAVWDFIADRVRLLPPTRRRAAQERLEAARGNLPESAPVLASHILRALDDIRPVAEAAPVVPANLDGTVAASEVFGDSSAQATDLRSLPGARAQALRPDTGTGIALDPESPLVTLSDTVDARDVFDNSEAEADDLRALPDARAQAFRQPPEAPRARRSTDQGIRPGDRVIFNDVLSESSSRSVPAEVLETTGSGDNVRHRIRLDGPEGEGSASQNRSERAARERLVDDAALTLEESGPVEDGSRRERNRERAASEREAGAEPRFAAAISEEQREQLVDEGLAAPFVLGASFAEDARLVGALDQVRKRASDEFLAVAKFQEAAKKLGADLSSNPESAVRRFFGKIADRAERLEKSFTKPFKDALANSKVTVDQAGRHVMARHVPEANAEFLRQWETLQSLRDVRKKLLKAMRGQERLQRAEDDLRALDREIARFDNLPKRLPEGVSPEQYFHETNPLSGLKTSQAEEITSANLSGEQAATYREVGRLVDQLNRETRDRLLDDGLITEDQHSQWSTQFQHYVPLRSADPLGLPFPSRGSGFQIRGPESKRRKGRKTEADNPIIFSIQQALRGIERGEKNRVGQEFLDFARKNQSLMELDLREDLEEGEDGKPRLDDTEFHLKVDGRDVAINVKDQELANALRRVEVARIPSFLRLYAKGIGVWRGLVTSFSPEFIVTNAFRDVQQALGNAQSVSEQFDVKDLRKGIRRNLVKSSRAVWQWQRGVEDSTGLRGRLEEFSGVGGRIGTITSPNFEELSRQIEGDVKRAGSQTVLGKSIRGAMAAKDVIEDANAAVEGAARFALFNALRDAGVSSNDAALASRQLTTDFSQKGTWGSMVSLFYVFASASVGGNRRLLQELLRSKKSQKFAAGLVGYGFAAAFLNEEFSDEDEDGLSVYSKIAEHEKSRNHIIMIPGASEPLKVPMPYGWSIFPAAGRLAAEYVMGQKSIARASRDLLTESIETFNPIGSSPTAFQFVAPTIADPFVQIAENKNFAGSPIRPQENPFAAKTARHRRAFRSNSETAKGVARAINAATGGDDVEPGALNFGAGDVEHVLEFFGGGTLRFALNSAKTAEKLMSGDFEADDFQTAPFIRRLYGSRTEFTDRSRFFEARDDIQIIKARIKDAERANERDKVRELQRRHGPALALDKRWRSVEKQRKELEDRAHAGPGRPDRELLKKSNALLQAWVKDYFIAVGRVEPDQ